MTKSHLAFSARMLAACCGSMTDGVSLPAAMPILALCGVLALGHGAQRTGAATIVTRYYAGALQPVTDGTIITQLLDISGNNNHATGSGGTYVASGIGGLASVKFATNNVDDGYRSAFAMGTKFGIQGDAGWTQIFVVRLDNTYAGSPTARPIFGGLGNGYTFGGMAGLEVENVAPGMARFDVAGGNSTDVVINPPDSFNQFIGRDVIITVTHRGNTGASIFDTANIFINGFAPGTGLLAGNTKGETGGANIVALDLSNEPISLGTTFDQGYVGFNGLLAEVVVYDDEISDDDRRQIERELARKYDIPEVPEPSSAYLLGVGLSVGTLSRRSRRLR